MRSDSRFSEGKELMKPNLLINFSTEKSIEGYTMAQAFYGCTSGTIHMNGMKLKEEFFRYIWSTQKKQVYHIPLKEIIEKLQGIINIECGKTLWSYTEVRKVLSLWRSQTVDNVGKKTSLKEIQTAVLAYVKEEVDKKQEVC